METHSVENVLEAIYDSKSLDILCSIAKNTVESEVLKATIGLSRKQYYLRTRRLLRTGLVQRKKGRFSLTAFGTVVYHALLVVEGCVKNYWKLKAIDSIQSSVVIGGQERKKLIKTILDDNTIESILLAQR